MFNTYLPNYGNYGTPYAPMSSAYQPNQLNQLQNQPNQQGINQQNVQWVQVNGIDGARNHIVQPNQTLWLMDNNEPVFYVKSADNLGTTTLKAYKFEEVSDKINSKTLLDKNEVNLSEYVKKSEIDEIIMNKLNQIEQGKGE